MCGIVGYIGDNHALAILVKSLKRLEYRGYDSAGICTFEKNKLFTTKCSGKVTDLEMKIKCEEHLGKIGIAHTRWATHGSPSEENAHPHSDDSGKISLIHNGIIENYYSIKEFLINENITFVSDTDTEVLVKFIGYFYNHKGYSFFESVKQALSEIVGAYGILVMCEDDPDKLIAARNGSPLVIGIGDKSNYVASDVSAIIENTRNVLFIEDGEIVEVFSDNYNIRHLSHNQEVKKEVEKIELTLEQIEKGDYKHFMLKEIFEQPHSIKNAIRGRIDGENIFLGGVKDFMPEILDKEYIYITACGTSWHAAQIGSYILESVLKKPVKVEYASEFRYRNEHISSSSLVISISQSGETADTLSAVKKAKECGAFTLGIVNVVGSAIARETHCGIYMHAGPEIGVASTKAFTSQVLILSLLGNFISQRFEQNNTPKIINDIKLLPEIISNTLELSDKILSISKEYFNANNFLYLGRGYQFPVALEGALKLKEISYIHAEGYPGAEMKHGPIALIDHNMPVVAIVTEKGFDKIFSNIQEVKSRGGKLISISTVNNSTLKEISDHFIYIDSIKGIDNSLSPIVTIIPLQLLAYHIAVLRGCNIDQPRNLAKSVTVE